MKISIDSVKSLAIQTEYRHAHCRHADYLGSFQHPQHLHSADWTLHLYSVCDELVFETNGDPVWETTNPSDFATLALEYGIDLDAVTPAS
jgi:hypothetical protein